MSAVATAAPRVRARVAAVPGWVAAAAGLAVLVAGSVALRTTAIHAGFWIDEGLSVGIASHPLGDIPSVLRQDGSPPLYYLLLGVWMRVFSDGQATTHMLSLVLALATIPLGWWAGRSLFGARAGWGVALLATVNPFLTYYAQETRMYTLVSLLSLAVAATFAHAFVWRRRAYLAPFALSLAALLYSHNWGLFLAAGTVVALVPAWLLTPLEARRALRRDALLAYGGAALLYAPWVPTLLFQAAHTGAPWSERPSLGDITGPLSGVLGGEAIPLGLLLAGGTGLAAIVQRRRDDEPEPRRRAAAVWALVVLPLAALVLAWLASQVSPAYTGRYFAIFVGPLLLLAGIGLASAGRLGLVALALVVALSLHPRTAEINGKGDARLVASLIAPHVHPGDLVVSVHPEQAPVLRYYFPPGLRYATALGPMPDPQVFDWRDALDRLRAAGAAETLDRLLDGMHPGQRLILALPIIRTAAWGAPWTKLVRERSREWQAAAHNDPRLHRIVAEPRFRHRRLPRGVRTVIYQVQALPQATSGRVEER